nr:GNAT family N-acetyltransferase [Nakamurella flavida]
MTRDDAMASTAMSRNAFGGSLDLSFFTLGAGITRWGLFDGADLVAKANDRHYDSLIGGRPVPTAGVGGVVVTPETHGRGSARTVMTHLLHRARERGAVISTLFRTVPALYRSLGYEQVTERVDGALPSAALRGMRVPAGITLRRATVADAPAVRQVYDDIAAQGSCWLDRRPPLFPRGTAADADLISAVHGTTLAVDDAGTVQGYVRWTRGDGVGTGAVLTASELLSRTASGTAGLLAALASFDAVTPEIHLRTTGTDPVFWAVPGYGWRVEKVEPYLLRVIDLAGAVAARGWPVGVSGALELTVTDPLCPWNSGDHRLVIEGGRGRLEPGDGSGVSVTVNGSAVLIAGSIGAAALRRGGMVAGGGAEHDAVLDVLTAGPRPGILDFF